MSKQSFFIQTYGVEALRKTFEGLEKRDRRGIMLTAFRKALKPTVDIAQTNAPEKSGLLKRSIGLKAVPGEVAMYAGARIKGGWKGYIGHIMEEGTVDRYRKTKNNAATGKIKYSGFFKRAADSTERQAINIVAGEWERAVARFIIRSNRLYA